METTLIKQVKGSTMEQIFDNPDNVNVKHYKALSLHDENMYDGAKVYKYEILIRHAEGTNARELFESALKLIKEKTKEMKKKIQILQNFLEENGFTVYLTEQDNVQCAEIEKWTDGGVDMIIFLKPFTIEEFKSYVVYVGPAQVKLVVGLKGVFSDLALVVLL